MSWQEQLEELEKSLLQKGFGKEKDDDEDDDGDDYEADDNDSDDDGEDDEKKDAKTEKCVTKGISGTKGDKGKEKAKGRYAPAPQGEDDDPNDEESTNQGKAKVHDATSIERKTRGGKVGFGAGTRVRKSVTEELDDATSDAIEVSPVLTNLTKSIEALAEAGAADVQQLAGRVRSVEKSLNAIGKALVASLTNQGEIAKSLAARVEAVEAQPVGRRSIVKGVEKKFAGQEAGGAPQTYDQIMKKAVTACKAGKITPFDVTKLESDLQKGLVNRAVLAKIDAED